MRRRNPARWAPALLALAVGACGGGGDADTSNVYCPAPYTVQDVQRLTHFRDGAGRDPRNIAWEAAIVGAGTTCELRRGQMEVSLIMRITVTAGPAVDAGVTRVPYFVRVQGVGGTVIQGQDFTADFKLGGSNPRGSSQEELTLRLPYSDPSELAAYRIAIGLKPTREELDYSRRGRGGS